MKTEVQDLGGSQKKIVCEIPSDEVQKEVDKYCKTLAREVEVRGFRKGKAPPSIIKRYFRQQVQEVWPEDAVKRADCFAAFLNADWNRGIVTIRKGGRKKVLDFTK